MNFVKTSKNSQLSPEHTEAYLRIKLNGEQFFIMNRNHIWLKSIFDNIGPNVNDLNVEYYTKEYRKRGHNLCDSPAAKKSKNVVASTLKKRESYAGGKLKAEIISAIFNGKEAAADIED